jgi:hypothetical protein
VGELKKIYVVMRRSGAIMRFRDGLSGDQTSHGGPYTFILDAIANELNSAGGEYDAPDKLFLNGKVVVESALATKAWEYQRDAVAAREQARRAVNALHRPEWCDEGDGHASEARGWHVAKATTPNTRMEAGEEGVGGRG